MENYRKTRTSTDPNLRPPAEYLTIPPPKNADIRLESPHGPRLAKGQGTIWEVGYVARLSVLGQSVANPSAGHRHLTVNPHPISVHSSAPDDRG